MAEIPVTLVDLNGELLGKLRYGVLALITEAEQTARVQNLSKRSVLPIVLREHIESTGYHVKDEELTVAVSKLSAIRSGERLSNVQIVVDVKEGFDGAKLYNSSVEEKLLRKSHTMISTQNQLVKFFELERVYPDKLAQSLYERLIGIDDHKQRLLIELEMLLFPEKLESWSRKCHQGRILRLCELQRSRVPLILLEGYVGTGKTALAETIGDALARRIGSKTKVHLLKINTQVRGTGQVGEMSDLIVQAFVHAEARASSLSGEPLLLLLDEADALATRRDNHQMHHEDKAGLNTILQRLDNLRLTRLPIAVMFITNRPEALDPAIRRRAALNLFFERPENKVREQIIRTSIPEIALTSEKVAELVFLTGSQAPKNKGFSFTASDVTDRLLPGALREAYSQGRELKAEDLINQAHRIEPTPRMGSE